MPSTSYQNWVKLPNHWIESKGLKEFQWNKGQGSNELAALMCLIAIAHRAEQNTGVARITYDDLSQATGLSRAKISEGLKKLHHKKIITTENLDRSYIKIVGFEPEKSWAKLPAKGLYKNESIKFFSNITLRNRNELNALKLYLLFASRRDNETNMSHISYLKIEEYTGIDRNHISAALSILAANSLVFTSTQPSVLSELGNSHSYRLFHLESRRHQGTVGKASA